MDDREAIEILESIMIEWRPEDPGYQGLAHAVWRLRNTQCACKLCEQQWQMDREAYAVWWHKNQKRVAALS